MSKSVRHSLGIGVHHDGAVAQLPEGHRRPNAAVVELDTLPDPVGAAPKDHHVWARPLGRASFSSSYEE